MNDPNIVLEVRDGDTNLILFNTQKPLYTLVIFIRFSFEYSVLSVGRSHYDSRVLSFYFGRERYLSRSRWVNSFLWERPSRQSGFDHRLVQSFRKVFLSVFVKDLTISSQGVSDV